MFVAVVQAGGFTAAARQLGMSKSAVSARVAGLEERLGARLLQRTTRKMRLTDVGATYYARAQEIVNAAGEAELEVTRLQNTAVGVLRVSAPMSFGRRYLADTVARFLGTHPHVSAELHLADRSVDLIEEGFDLAIRAGVLADSSLVARKLVESKTLVVGSPEYFRQRGEPREPEDLRGHECLRYTLLATGDNWVFDGPGGRRSVRVHGRLRANNGDLLADAAAAGAGIAFLPDFVAMPLVESGRLQVVLDEHCRARLPVHALYPQRRHLSTKVRLFVELLARTIGSHDPPCEMPTHLTTHRQGGGS